MIPNRKHLLLFGATAVLAVLATGLAARRTPGMPVNREAEYFTACLECYEEKRWQAIDWASDLDSALDKGRREDKPVFLAFTVRAHGRPDAPDT